MMTGVMGRLARILAVVACAWAACAAQAVSAAQPGAEKSAPDCISCHDGSRKIEVPTAGGGTRTLKPIPRDRLAAGAHAKLSCADCHGDVVDNVTPHKRTGQPKPDCAGCHQTLWDQAVQDGKAESSPGLQVVMWRIEHRRLSVHARPNKDDPTRPNAACAQCHDSHTFARIPAEGPARVAFRLGIPEKCGSCHEDELDEYRESIHGKTVLEKHDPRGAICADCHNPHGVDNTSKDAAKLSIVKACGNCHKENAASYTDTYHGQITQLGYTFTAKCFNCHGSHDIRAVDDPESRVHPNNRLETCQQCHKRANARFITFQPHGNAHDFKRYPMIWLATRFMAGLLLGTFAFFWVHLALWLYRETQERKRGKAPPHVRVDQLGIPPGKYVRRFGPWARLGHLLFATSLMVLALTGMTLLYAGSAWAPVVVKLLGGPKVAGIIHRSSAVIFIGVFIVHLGYIIVRFLPRLRSFNWFGPDSLIPSLQDLKDIVAMFKWFLGTAEKPVFDRWTYWEKFDYWAPFWGVTIVGVSGLMMWFPHITSRFLPGWVFNVAAITHGEEAFLAAVFLFTVHFFNNHFRPEKFPLDTVMFTGSMPLEHFARDHALQYRRMVASGELQKYLEDAPSRPLALGSRILGFTLIGFGLLLLVLILVGFLSGMRT
jgi:cytochrome b subunit of formate dehydrogenase